VEHEGGFGLTRVLGGLLAFEEVVDGDVPDVDDANARLGGERVARASRWGSWRWAVMMMNSVTPWPSQASRSSLRARWRVFRPREAVPAYARSVGR
jgi:hypothetical protein